MGLKYLEDFYGIKFLNKQKDILQKMNIKRELPLLLVGEDEGSRLLQIQFDKYLELAFRHNIVDANLQKRLKSSNWKEFQQTHQELMCAYFFEQILRFDIHFYPTGKGDSIGDLLATTSNKESIFVEIKTPIRKIPKSAWCGDDRHVIKKNVKRAREQMDSNEEIFNLVVISGELKDTFIGQSSGMVAALYGEHYDSFPVGQDIKNVEFTEGFNPSGLFQPDSYTRISAVATLKDMILLSFDENLSKPEFNFIFYVYHNLYAKRPFENNIFRDYPQFVFNKSCGTMEWRNPI